MSFATKYGQIINGAETLVSPTIPNGAGAVTRNYLAGAICICSDPTLGVDHWVCTTTGSEVTSVWTPVASGDNLILRIPFLFNSSDGPTTFTAIDTKFWIAHATRDWRFVVEAGTGQPGWVLPAAPAFWRVGIAINVNAPSGAASHLEFNLYKNDGGSGTPIAQIVPNIIGSTPDLGGFLHLQSGLTGLARGDIANVSMCFAPGGTSATLQAQGYVDFFKGDPGTTQ